LTLELAQNREPVELGEKEVEHDEVVALAERAGKPSSPVT
jgi:hypothetical protein